VKALEVMGSVADRPVLIVDDMITTGATIAAAARAVLDQGARPDLIVAATHNVLGLKMDDLGDLPIRRLFHTDSLAHSSRGSTRFESVSLAPLLAEAIQRLHEHRPLDDLVAVT
jgi:ribose-phosphate pyrophosphokinase